MFFKVAILALVLVASGHCAPAELNTSAARSANGGVDAAVSLSQQLGENARATVAASGNTNGGPVTTGAKLEAGKNGFGAALEHSNTHGVSSSLTKSAFGTVPLGQNNALTGTVFDSKISPVGGPSFNKQGGSLAWENANGLGASIAKERIPGFSDTLTKSAHATVFQNNNHKVGASVFDTRTSFANGFPDVRKSGGNLDWASSRGHGADLGVVRHHDFGTQAKLGLNTNLFTSNDGNTRIGANAGASRWLSGPMSGRNDYGFGFGLNHRW